MGRVAGGIDHGGDQGVNLSVPTGVVVADSGGGTENGGGISFPIK